MAMLANDIYIGSVSAPLYHYSNVDIALNGAKCSFSVDTIGNELSVDSFSFTVKHTPDGAPINGRFIPKGSDQLLTSDQTPFLVVNGRSGKDYLTNVSFGTPVFWDVEGEHFTKGYAKSVERIAKDAWKITCVSGVGLLDEKIHVGGIYVNVTLSDLFAEIVGNSFTYEFGANAGATLVSGHLPYDTARNNLHRLLFACGASLTRGNEATDYIVTFLNQITTFVPESRIYLGGSVSNDLPTNYVEVTEHGFYALPTDQTLTLFDNTADATVADHVIVTFADPMHNLVASGLTINEQGANYAVVSGIGTLTGQKYSHTEQLVVIDDVASGEMKRTRSVRDNHLVSSSNSYNVARRVMNYFSAARKIRAKINLQGEKCGQCLQMSDPFGENTTAFIERMDVAISTVIGASCELIQGFTPGPYGNYFNSYLIVTGQDLSNGTWAVPAELQGKKARIVLFSGAQGGQGGWYGETKGENQGGAEVLYFNDDINKDYRFYGALGKAQSGGAGGKGGNGGASASRLINIDIATLGASYSVTLGAGGNGGTGGTAVRSTPLALPTLTPPTDGEPGGDSVFDGVSTAQGTSFAGTYLNIVTGEVIAKSGDDGVDGGDGGRGGNALEYVTFDTAQEASNFDYSNSGRGFPGMPVGANAGGSGAIGEAGNQTVYFDGKYWLFSPASGAGGGGAADGSNGSAGTSGVPSTLTRIDSTGSTAWTGAGLVFVPDEGQIDFTNCAVGGNGGNAVTVPAQAIFTGGKGGAGGGGGGGAGQATGFLSYTLSGGYRLLGVSYGGKGGNGGNGGKGSDGFFVVYYQS